MKKLLAVLALLLVASMLLVACKPEQPPVEETTPEETTTEPGTTDPGTTEAVQFSHSVVSDSAAP